MQIDKSLNSSLNSVLIVNIGHSAYTQLFFKTPSYTVIPASPLYSGRAGNRFVLRIRFRTSRNDEFGCGSDKSITLGYLIISSGWTFSALPNL